MRTALTAEHLVYRLRLAATYCAASAQTGHLSHNSQLLLLDSLHDTVSVLSHVGGAFGCSMHSMQPCVQILYTYLQSCKAVVSNNTHSRLSCSLKVQVPHSCMTACKWLLCLAGSIGSTHRQMLCGDGLDMQGFTSEGRVVANKHRNQSVAIMDISHCCACRCLYSLGSFLHISSYITAACSLFTAIAQGDDMYLQLHQEVHYNMFCMLVSWCSGRCAAYLK